MAEVPAGSRYVIRSVESLKVAFAGLSNAMPVKGDLDGFTLLDLRALTALPAPLEVFIPYRLFEDSVVTVNLLQRTESTSDTQT